MQMFPSNLFLHLFETRAVEISCMEFMSTVWFRQCLDEGAELFSAGLLHFAWMFAVLCGFVLWFRPENTGRQAS